MTGVVLFAISSATAGLAPSTGALVASRVTQGVGAALMMPATLSIITNAFPPAERGRAIGTWAGVSALALALGTAARRLPDRARLLAGDLLPQHPGRRRRGRHRPVRRPRVARRDRRPRDRLGRHGGADRRPDRRRARPDRGQQLGLGLGADHRPDRGLDRPARPPSPGSRAGSGRRSSSSSSSATATSSGR